MKPWLAIGAALLGAAILVFASAADAQDRRVALVVGNARYAEAPLRNPVNDARAMAAALRERGFEVLLRENATKQQFERAVADFGEKLTENSTGLFYYAGHGMQVQGRNYLVPIDARITAEARVRLEAVDVDAVLDQMQAARSRVNVVILDACRNNPFERRFRSAGGGLAQINAPEGTLIAYATAPGKVAADGDGSNGLYTQELLRALRSPGLKVEDVFKQVRVNVSRASDGAQTPWEASSLIGDFYFVPAEPPKPAPPTPSPQELVEERLWNASKASTDSAELQVYLRQFPNGRFAAEARQRLASLTPPPPPAPSAPREEAIELAFWELIKTSTATAELQAYLQHYPSGRFAALARTRLASLNTARPSPSLPPAPAPSSPEPQQVAVAVVPPKPAAVGSLDGKYSATITGATWLYQEIPAEIEIKGTQVTGSAMRREAPRPCSIIGVISEDGMVQPGIQMECEAIADTGSMGLRNPRISMTLKGRFSRSSDGGDFVGETPFRTHDGLTGTITWRRATDGTRAVPRRQP